MPADPFVVIEIHGRHPMATKFSQCRRMAIKFSCHAIVAIKIFSIATMSLPSPLPLFYFPSLFPPPNGDRNPFNRHLL
jgi:hypothetical protein